MFRIYDHRDDEPVSVEIGSFDEVIAEARQLSEREPDRFLEVQRLEPNEEVWIPTGWTFGVQGDWD